MVSNKWAYSGNTLTTGTWHHVVGSCLAGDYIRVYLDSLCVTGAEVISGIDQRDVIRIGYCDVAATRKLDGLIDEVAVWNRHLTDAEVADLYNGGSGLYINPASTFPSSGTSMNQNLLRLWHMDDGGATANDSDSSDYGVSAVGTAIGTGDWVEGKINRVAWLLSNGWAYVSDVYAMDYGERFGTVRASTQAMQTAITDLKNYTNSYVKTNDTRSLTFLATVTNDCRTSTNYIGTNTIYASITTLNSATGTLNSKCTTMQAQITSNDADIAECFYTNGTRQMGGVLNMADNTLSNCGDIAFTPSGGHAFSRVMFLNTTSGADFGRIRISSHGLPLAATDRGAAILLYGANYTNHVRQIEYKASEHVFKIGSLLSDGYTISSNGWHNFHSLPMTNVVLDKSARYYDWNGRTMYMTNLNPFTKRYSIQYSNSQTSKVEVALGAANSYVMSTGPSGGLTFSALTGYATNVALANLIDVATNNYFVVGNGTNFTQRTPAQARDAMDAQQQDPLLDTFVTNQIICLVDTDGAGSGLDSDYFDGFDSADFQQTDATSIVYPTNTASDVMQVTTTNGWFYLGPLDTVGTWRMGIMSNNFIHQRYEGSAWVTKNTILATP